MNSHMADLGANIKAYFCGLGSLTAGGAGDNTEITGAEIDHLGYAGCKLIVTYSAALTNTKTLSLQVEYEAGSATTVYDAAVELRAAAVAKTATSSTTFTGVLEYDIVLSSKKRFIRFNVTPDLNHTGTDTAIVGVTAILYGADTNPVTQSASLTT